MSMPGALEKFQRFSGLIVIPGTLNLKMTEHFNLKLLNYVSFNELGWEFSPAKQGIKYYGEIGMHYGGVTVADKYPACLIFFTWIVTPDRDTELISPYHLRRSLGIKDGDKVNLTLIDNPNLLNTKNDTVMNLNAPKSLWKNILTKWKKS
jgi:CTP-dependent riboflavin kinase